MKKITKLFIICLVCTMVVGVLPLKANAISTITYYTTANVNMRATPSTTGKKVCTVPKSSKVIGIGYSNGWSKVKYSTRQGWIKQTYLTRTTPSSPTPNTGTTTTGKVLPRLIIVNKDSLKVALYVNGKLNISYRCAIGKASSPTPSGKFSIQNKIINPYYAPKRIAGGSPKNPLGTRWIGLSGHYGIHGTNVPNQIGMNVSSGCVRLDNANVQTLFNKVKVGDTVIIGNGYNRNLSSKYGIKIN